MFNEYPHTDLHELNLDWIIKKVKELSAAWVETCAAWQTQQEAFDSLRAFVNDYFDNLDVQEEINNKIDDLVTDGTLSELIAPYVASGLPAVVATQLASVVAQQIAEVVADQLPAQVAAQLPAIAAQAAVAEVSAWLLSHINPDTGYVIDDTLRVRGAAADAEATGEEIEALKSALDEVTYTANNLLNKDDENYLSNKYLSGGVTPVSDTRYSTTGFIELGAGETLYFGNDGEATTVRFVYTYGASDTYYETLQNVSNYTRTSIITKVRVTFNNSDTKFQINKGELKPYDIYGFWLNENKLPTIMPKITALENEMLSITGQHKPCYKKYHADAMVANDILQTFNHNIKKNNHYSFSSVIGTFGSIRIGHGSTAYYHAGFVTIDSNNAIVTYTDLTEHNTTYAHGLNISGAITVDIKVDQKGKATIRIASNGGVYTIEGVTWYGESVGFTYAKCISGSLSDCNFLWECEDLDAYAWIFGDSYVSLDNDARWVTLLVNDGYDRPLVNGYPGQESSQARISFEALLSSNTALPKIAIWCLGMNDNADTDTYPTVWYNAIANFRTSCKNNGIIPILATIPSVPNRSNEYKNAWVRNSGERYIDFASAVGAQADGTWYSGMLSSDNLHPTVSGAHALYLRALYDVPELAYVYTEKK